MNRFIYLRKLKKSLTNYCVTQCSLKILVERVCEEMLCLDFTFDAI